MVDPKESKELSAEELASISGGMPSVIDGSRGVADKLSKNAKFIDEGKTNLVSKNRDERNNVSGGVVN